MSRRPPGSTVAHAEPQAPSTRLARRLTLADAVVVGLGSMVGAGIFAAVGPAADAAGAGLLVALAIAAVVAYCNATSTASLAAVHPESGGAYAYGRARLGPFWGHLAGWAFVTGKTASCAAVALTFGAYAAPTWRRPLAVLAVVTLTAVNVLGVRKTVAVTRVLVTFVLGVLVLVVACALAGGSPDVDRLGPLTDGGWSGTLEAAGLLFFAFAGYARIATLGEEVVDPARTIPRAVPVALGAVLVVYAVVATVALLTVGPSALATSPSPLTTVVRAGSADWAAPVVRFGAAVACLGVLVSLLAGVGRTVFAMAANGDLPRCLDAVHPTRRTPWRAEVAVCVVVASAVALADLRAAIGFSSLTVLTYYAVANAAAWTLPRSCRRPTGRALAALGLLGCTVLAATLPAGSVAGGVVVLAVGSVARLSRSAAPGSRTPSARRGPRRARNPRR